MRARSLPLQKRLSTAVDGLVEVAENLFARLRDLSADTEGVTRPSYSQTEEAAATLIGNQGRAWNFGVRRDHACNLFVERQGSEARLAAVLTGSHLDSVPQGGNYDGAAGVIGGLLALRALDIAGFQPSRTVGVMGTRGEESAWFSIHHIGSRAALGLLPEAELDSARRVDSGNTLAQHLEELGGDVAALRRGEPSLAPGSVRAFLELHIEQGPVLEHRDIPIGLVTGIRGNVRVRDGRCIGAYSHSGATPRDMRRDAVMAMAEFVGRAEAEWRALEENGGDLVLTFGKFYTDAVRHTHSKVPGEVRFTIDARSHQAQTLDRVEEFLRKTAEDISRRRGVEINLGKIGRVKPAPMSVELRRMLGQGVTALGLSAVDIASGGGHDAGDFANHGVPAAMIFVRNPHGSHNPHESMAMADFVQGVKLLAWTMAKLAEER